MFSNRFNTKNDPLVEAVQNAMQDGEIRRQAVAQVNEAFGVFNRNAVVREQLAAYDAAIEEAYKCMKEAPDTGESDARKTVTSSKEAKEKVFAKHKERMKKLEDKPKADYSKMREKMVGKGKDLETTRKIVGEAKKLADKDYDKDGKVESPKDEVWGSRFRAAKMAGKMEEKKAWEEVDYSAPDRAAVTRDNKPSTPAQTNAATSGPSAADKAALTSKIKTMKEAAYSAKAARAGKDIGKPGKEFKKIAKSAAERYGSEERGKKVAGAILKKIRAKHMKEENLEELSAFGKAFAAAKGQNFSFGGKQYSGAMKGQTGSSSASRPSVTSAPRTNTPGTQGVATGKSFAAIDKATAKADKATPKVTTPSTPSAGAARDVGLTGKAGGETGVNTTSGAFGNPNKTGFNARTVSLDRPGNVGARPAGAGAAGTTTSGTSTPAPSSSPEQSRAAPGTFAARSAAGEMKADAASAGVKKLMSMNESVQVGANKYRIV